MSNDELLSRGVEDIVPADVARKKINSREKLRIYMGIDPTGSRLHIGHSVPLRKLQQFSEAGHEVIFLIGSYTAMIGDPTGRDKMREPLTKEEVKKNFESYKEQAGKVLNFSKVRIAYNHEWLEKLRTSDILEIMSHFTVQQMLQRDMFQERIKKGQDLSPTEFLYPLMQGYDSVMLDVDCEVGGNDQLFNMLCGRKLQKDYGKREKFVVTTRLIEGTDGRKMSKTYDNCIYLDDSPKDMYGKTLSIKDDLIAVYMECCTDIPMKEILKIEQKMRDGANPKEFKMRLARELVTMYHDEDAAIKAEEEFSSVFAKGGIPEDMPEAKAKKGEVLIDLLVREKIVASKSEARRLIDQKAVSIDGELIDTHDFGFEGLTPEALAKGVIVKVGKRKFVKVI
jgi:tyrosyl-tRNA synthetase